MRIPSYSHIYIYIHIYIYMCVCVCVCVCVCTRLHDSVDIVSTGLSNCHFLASAITRVGLFTFHFERWETDCHQTSLTLCLCYPNLDLRMIYHRYWALFIYYIANYIYMSVCVCVHVCVWEREREGEKGFFSFIYKWEKFFSFFFSVRWLR